MKLAGSWITEDAHWFKDVTAKFLGAVDFTPKKNSCT